MPNEGSMSDKKRKATDHEAHIDDPEEWDDTSAEDVIPRPSGMAVFSFRLPVDEFAFLNREAERRHTTMSELTRTALRFYLLPRATGSLSATAIHHLQVTTLTPSWTGGVADAAEVRPETPVPLGNVVPRPARVNP